MTDLTVEKLSPLNILGVKDICDLSFATPWSLISIEKELINKNAVYIVIRLGNKVVAFGGCWLILDEAHITNIAVHPNFRGNSFGDIVVENLINSCKELKISSMTLEVRASNLAAINLYKKHNFTLEGVRKNFYEHPNEDAHIMWNYNI
ncbi:MAG: ribosomal protein S18-alanine N-acetyltransferase [Clostridium sp.]